MSSQRRARLALPPAAPPSARRQLVVNFFVGIFLVGSAVSVATGREYWPFSPYPVFHEIQGSHLVLFDVVGVPANDSDDEVALAPSRATSILAGTRYRVALEMVVKRGDRDEIHSYLTSLARRYGDRHPQAVSLRAARLYESHWEAAPLEWPPARRITRQLVTEIELTQ